MIGLREGTQPDPADEPDDEGSGATVPATSSGSSWRATMTSATRIEERDTALEFDEEYLLQMYTNMITNYTVFKSLLEVRSAARCPSWRKEA